MNHSKSGRKFGRKRNVRNALIKSLALSVILKEKIRTTEAKAKEVRPFVEKLITHSKNPTVASRRLLVSRVGALGSKKLIDVIGPKYKERSGGYTRITKLAHRATDAAPMASIELV